MMGRDSHHGALGGVSSLIRGGLWLTGARTQTMQSSVRGTLRRPQWAVPPVFICCCSPSQAASRMGCVTGPARHQQARGHQQARQGRSLRSSCPFKSVLLAPGSWAVGKSRLPCQRDTTRQAPGMGRHTEAAVREGPRPHTRDPAGNRWSRSST